MRIQQPIQRYFSRSVVALILLFVAPLLNGVEVPKDRSDVSEYAKQANIESRRVRLNAYAKALTDRHSTATEGVAMPTEDVFAVMSLVERKGLAIGASRIYDRILSTNVCTDLELEWGKRVLSYLRISDGDDAAAVIRHVHETPLHLVMTLEKLSQVESLMRTVYPKMVACGEAEAESFDRSSFKKALIRKQLSLMRGEVQ